MADGSTPARRTLELIRDESVRALHAAERAARERFNEARLFASLAAGLALVGFLLVAQWRGYGLVTGTPEVRSDSDLAVVVRELGTELTALRAEVFELDARLTRARTDAEGRAALMEGAAADLAAVKALSGAAAAVGPGVEVQVDDPSGTVMAEDAVALVNDLRAAGAEGIAVNGRRVVASSWFGSVGGGRMLDGVRLETPYVFEAIGDADVLEQALRMPGSVGTRLDAYPDVVVRIRSRDRVSVPAGRLTAFVHGEAKDTRGD